MSADLKAVVLCAGEGTRLRPLTFSKPKHLLPVAGRPLLGHVLSCLAEAGLEEIGLVVGHHPEAVQRYVGDGEQWGINATYIIQDQPLGLGHAVRQARRFVGDDNFIVYLGDNLLENGIADFVADFRRDGVAASLVLREVEDPRRYGVAILDENRRVTAVVEKPAEPPSNLAIVGVYAFESSIFHAIDSIQPSARGELELTDAIGYLIAHNYPISARVIEGFWEDAGEPRALLRANRRYLDVCAHEILGSLSGECSVEGTAIVGKGSRLRDSKLIGPVIIGRNCVLENATIGPYVSIGDGCEITDSAIRDSVIQSNCRISQLSAGLEGSVLGEDVQVVGGEPMNCPLHMILGDMAQIRMF